MPDSENLGVGLVGDHCSGQYLIKLASSLPQNCGIGFSLMNLRIITSLVLREGDVGDQGLPIVGDDADELTATKWSRAEAKLLRC